LSVSQCFEDHHRALVWLLANQMPKLVFFEVVVDAKRLEKAASKTDFQ
jgi:hypothetical protein